MTDGPVGEASCPEANIGNPLAITPDGRQASLRLSCLERMRLRPLVSVGVDGVPAAVTVGSGDGRVAFSPDGWIRVWDLRVDRWLDIGCEIAGRDR